MVECGRGSFAEQGAVSGKPRRLYGPENFPGLSRKRAPGDCINGVVVLEGFFKLDFILAVRRGSTLHMFCLTRQTLSSPCCCMFSFTVMTTGNGRVSSN